nr:hypothetical protein DA06_01305 [Georgenia sp. SUBG003]
MDDCQASMNTSAPCHSDMVPEYRKKGPRPRSGPSGEKVRVSMPLRTTTAWWIPSCSSRSATGCETAMTRAAPRITQRSTTPRALTTGAGAPVDAAASAQMSAA